MLRCRLAIAGALLALGCAGAGARSEADGAGPTAASHSTGEPSAEQLQLFEEALRTARFSFVDPTTMEAYTASGPYRFVAATADGVEFSGYDGAYQSASLTLFLDGNRLWARVLIANREFLTRVQ